MFERNLHWIGKITFYSKNSLFILLQIVEKNTTIVYTLVQMLGKKTEELK